MLINSFLNRKKISEISIQSNSFCILFIPCFYFFNNLLPLAYFIGVYNKKKLIYHKVYLGCFIFTKKNYLYFEKTLFKIFIQKLSSFFNLKNNKANILVINFEVVGSILFNNFVKIKKVPKILIKDNKILFILYENFTFFGLEERFPVSQLQLFNKLFNYQTVPLSESFSNLQKCWKVFQESSFLLKGYFAVKQQQWWVSDNFSTIPTYSFNIFRSYFLFKHKRFKLFKILLKPLQYKLILSSFKGGVVHCKKFVDYHPPYLFNYDINSLYPFIMSEFWLPCGPGFFMKASKLKGKNLKKYYGFLEVVVKKNISRSYLWKKVDLQKETFFVSELIQLLSFKKLVLLEICSFLVFYPYKFIFNSYCKTLYQSRLISFNINNKFWNKFNKLLLNTFFGRLGIKPLNFNQRRDDTYNVVTNLDIKTSNLFNYNLKKPFSNLVFTQIAAAVTAFGRIYVNSLILKLNVKNIVILEILTDSFLINTNLLQNSLKLLVGARWGLLKKDHILQNKPTDLYEVNSIFSFISLNFKNLTLKEYLQALNLINYNFIRTLNIYSLKKKTLNINKLYKGFNKKKLKLFTMSPKTKNQITIPLSPQFLLNFSFYSFELLKSLVGINFENKLQGYFFELIIYTSPGSNPSVFPITAYKEISIGSYTSVLQDFQSYFKRYDLTSVWKYELNLGIIFTHESNWLETQHLYLQKISEILVNIELLADKKNILNKKKESSFYRKVVLRAKKIINQVVNFFK